MNYIDVIIIIPCLLSAFSGYKSGLVNQITALLALIIGVVAAFLFFDDVAEDLVACISMDVKYLKIISFFVLFVLVFSAIHLLGGWLDNFVKHSLTGTINGALGSVFAVIKTIFIFSVVAFILTDLNREYGFLSEHTINGSLFFEPLANLILKLFPNFTFETILDIPKKI